MPSQGKSLSRFLWMDGWLMRLLTGESCTGDGGLEFGTHTYVCVCHTPPPPIRNQREIVHAWSTFFLAYGVQQHYSYVTLSTNWKTNKWCEFPHKIHSQRFQPFQVLNQINVFFTSWSRSFLLLHGGGQRMITSHLKHNWGDY